MLSTSNFEEKIAISIQSFFCYRCMVAQKEKVYGIFSLPVIVGALGFFVDIYDLLLFNIVRKSSFADLGVAESAMKNIGEKTISLQMLGLAIGGIIWGIL